MKRNLALIAGSLALALTLVAMIVPKQGPPMQSSEAPYWQAWREYEAAWRDARSLRELVRRGESRAVAQSLPRPAKPEIITRFDPQVGAAQRARLTAALEAEVRDAARGTLRHSVALVVIVTTAERDAVFRQAIVEPDAAGEPCTVIISASIAHVDRLSTNPTARLLGTCGFYAAFGDPGPAIKQWLRDTRSLSARFRRLPAAFADDTARIDLAKERSSYSVVEVDLYSCRAGRLASCDRVVAPDPLARSRTEYDAPARTEALARYEPGVLVLASGMPRNSMVQQGLLAALADELGPDRFAALWSGARSLPDAYAAETGHTLTEWASAYVASRTTPYHAGPGVPLLSTLMALAITLACAGWALGRTARRMT